MIALFHLAVLMLAFTRAPTSLLVALALVPPVGVSIFLHDAGPAKAAVLALIVALVLYAPAALVGSLFMQYRLGVAFRRLRWLYFILFNLVFVAVMFNLTQLIVGGG